MPGAWAGYGQYQNQPGLWDQFSTGFGDGLKTDFGGTVGGVADIATSLYGMYMGSQQLGMMEDQLDIKKDQWDMTKQELKHMQGTRKRLTNQYMGRSNQS